jgi:hypothetical protein
MLPRSLVSALRAIAAVQMNADTGERPAASSVQGLIVYPLADPGAPGAAGRDPMEILRARRESRLDSVPRFGRSSRAAGQDSETDPERRALRQRLRSDCHVTAIKLRLRQMRTDCPHLGEQPPIGLINALPRVRFDCPRRTRKGCGRHIPWRPSGDGTINSEKKLPTDTGGSGFPHYWKAQGAVDHCPNKFFGRRVSPLRADRRRPL